MEMGYGPAMPALSRIQWKGIITSSSTFGGVLTDPGGDADSHCLQGIQTLLGLRADRLRSDRVDGVLIRFHRGRAASRV